MSKAAVSPAAAGAIPHRMRGALGHASNFAFAAVAFSKA